MKISRSEGVKFSLSTLGLLTTVLLVSISGAAAKEQKAKKADNEAHVVAHMSFSGMSDVDMTIQKRVNDKYYLYVQHAKTEGISIIDISKPGQPKAVGVIPWPDPAGSGRMTVIGNLAIISESEGLWTHSSTSSDDLVLWDMADPASPRVVQKFSGVVKWLRDERNFVYVLNAEGLWVVSEPPDRQPEQVDSSGYGG